MLDGSVTVTVNMPPLDPWFIGICCGRPSVVPKSVAEVAWKVPHVTWNVTAVPGVTVDGVAKATALPGSLAVAARAGPQTEAANRLIGRINVPPPKTA